MTISESGALLSFKTGPYDDGDGLFFGQVGDAYPPSISDSYLASAEWTRKEQREGILLRPPNEVYGQGVTWDFEVTAAQQDGFRADSWNSRAPDFWTGPTNAAAYIVTVHVERVSGDLSGAGFRFDWDTDGGPQHQQLIPLADVWDDNRGSSQVVSMLFVRPPNYSGTFSRNEWHFYPNTTVFSSPFGPLSAKRIKIHRVSIRPAHTSEISAGRPMLNGGFGFSASRTTQSGIRQSVDLRDTGFTILNARHVVSGSTSPPPVMVETSRTINIPAGTSRISLVIVGGGGSGGANISGNPGQPTTAIIRDGTTVIRGWTSPGGNGGNTANSWKDARGQSSVFAAGGHAGSPSTGGESVSHPAGHGSRGSGGGAPNRNSPGGMAGDSISITDYDISTLTAPNIVVTIGAGGVRPSEMSGYGGNGVVQYRLSTDSDIPADVVPLKPTAWGTITKTGLNVTFPDLGAGMWSLFCEGDVNMDIGWVDVGGGREVFCHRGMTTFVSSQTPVRTRAGWSNNKTIHYLFYRMGSWA